MNPSLSFLLLVENSFPCKGREGILNDSEEGRDGFKDNEKYKK